MTSKTIRNLFWSVTLTLSALPALAQTKPVEDPKTRLAKAEAMFQERCKKSGEFIHRTAENVEGIFLLKVRPKEYNFGSQYAMDDPYGSDLGGDGYIGSFVRGSYDSMRSRDARPGWPTRLVTATLTPSIRRTANGIGIPEASRK